MEPTDIAAVAARVREQVARVVMGHDDTVDLLLTAWLAAGHVLLEGVPGTAKTLLARTTARLLDLQFRRIQFTPDLMPADVLGSSLFDFQAGKFSLSKGPVFTELLLADEINRTPPKTQSALLEAMQERSVTLDGESHQLGRAFFVLATQNPIEQEGTYPLPEAQLDRFLFKITIGYPSRDEERKMAAVHGRSVPDLDSFELETAAGTEFLAAARDRTAAIDIREDVLDYIVDLVRSTRDHSAPALRRLAARGQHVGSGLPRLGRDRGHGLRHPRPRQATRSTAARPPIWCSRPRPRSKHPTCCGHRATSRGGQSTAMIRPTGLFPGGDGSRSRARYHPHHHRRVLGVVWAGALVLIAILHIVDLLLLPRRSQLSLQMDAPVDRASRATSSHRTGDPRQVRATPATARRAAGRCPIDRTIRGFDQARPDHASRGPTCTTSPRHDARSRRSCALAWPALAAVGRDSDRDRAHDQGHPRCADDPPAGAAHHHEP